MKATLLIMAAGIGNRYGGLKQIDPIGPSGELIIDYSIYDALRAGFKKIVFVISGKIEKDFKQHIGNKLASQAEVNYVFQEIDHLPPGFSLPSSRAKPWGTAHAVLVAQDAIQEAFLAINADDYYGPSGYQTIFNYFTNLDASQSDDYSMVGFKLKNTLSEHGTVSRGICHQDRTGTLKDIVEYTKVEKSNPGARQALDNGEFIKFSGHELVSMNMWGFNPSVFDHLNQQFEEFLKENIDHPKAEFFIPTVVHNIIKSGHHQVKVLESQDKWFGVTYQQDRDTAKHKINQLIQGGIYPQKLF